jgi:hypothetical protein
VLPRAVGNPANGLPVESPHETGSPDDGGYP